MIIHVVYFQHVGIKQELLYYQNITIIFLYSRLYEPGLDKYRQILCMADDNFNFI